MNPVWIIFGAALAALLVLLVVWLYLKKKKEKAAAQAGGQPAPGSDEIALLVRDANARLAASRSGGARIASSPVFLLMGDSASAKTSVILQSGLEPELLAGQVYQDGSVAPTRAANLWFSRGVVFVEAGGALAADPQGWGRLASRLRPGSSVLSRGQQAPRAAVVCFDCEAFTRPGAHQAGAETARKLRARLCELSQALGIALPVYVLFTKMDRLPFFADFMRNLTSEEASQVVGVTLPLAGSRNAGVYAERQTALLTGEFDRLFRSLAALRLEYLPRETDPAKLPSVYEFPREFRKIRQLAVQFLVDLCRPSQLNAGPFLRGAYFSGVRPVILNESAPVAAAAVPQQSGYSGASDATSIFRPGATAPVPAAPAAQPFSRKVPQWMFLSHLFNDVFLADRIAMNASGESTGRSFLRRLLLAGAASLCLLLALAFTVSFARNRGLETDVRNAASAIPTTEITGSDIAPLDSLRRLEDLRQSVAKLVAWRSGAPWSFRWFLYSGDALLPEARRLYFERFRPLLLVQTKASIVRFLGGLPASNGPEYSPTYNALKAYIITTSHPEKSTPAFLGPELQNWWSNNRNVDSERSQLARKQFDFYAGQLPEGNPFSAAADDGAIARARGYLANFRGLERVYAFMLAETSKEIPPVNFNRQFPGSAEVVVDSHEVPGAFTKAGWTAMKDAMTHADRYVFGERWVLGDQGAANLDMAQLTQDLKARYNTDFINQWRAYLKSAAVLRYGGLKDGSQKLMRLSGPQSPLLELIALASQNTAVDDPAVAAIFQPVQAVVPPTSTDRYIAPPNQNYMSALVALQTSLESIADQPGQPSDAAVAPALANAGQAKINTRQMAQSFRPDPDGHLEAGVQKLLEDPITNVEGLLRTLGPAELNGKGKSLCGEFRTLFTKYPFNANATADATVAEVNTVFRKPGGALWNFYEQSLQKLLAKQGAQYAPTGAGGVNLSPAFVGFFNTAAAFSEALYAGGTPDPHFNYTLTAEPAEGIQGLTLQLDGQTLAYSGGKGTPKQFTWNGPGTHEASATVNFGGGPVGWSSNEGPWAVFRFFGEAERSQAAGSNQLLEWVVRTGARNPKPLTLPDGKPLTVRLTLDMNGAPRVFDRGFFSRMSCVADVARP